MKKQSITLLIILGSAAALLIMFSPEARQGAEEGLILSQHTIIPSLLPLLIIFLMIMKSGAKDVVARLFGKVFSLIFNLPYVCAPAIIFGMLGGYPTGALLTLELYEKSELSTSQAKRLMSFNFCGGCGFIITAIGCVRLNNHTSGVILLVSNVLSSLILGFLLSFREKRIKEQFYSFTSGEDFCELINSATSSAVSSVLNITAIITLFSAIMPIIRVSDFILPVIEITTGLCSEKSFSLPLLSAYLSFGGLCIHLQILAVIKRFGMSYTDFFIKRVISSVLSYLITSIFILIFPQSTLVFSNTSPSISLTSANYSLSILFIIACFVMVIDIKSKIIKL